MENYKGLLKGINTIVRHKNEMAKIKGESFNVFSILKLERRENQTHSAFIAELLNPKGSHLQGDIFLRLFFKVIDSSILDAASSQVFVEQYLGPRNDLELSGGRADIFIRDRKGNAVIIENKIDAIDQEGQLKRYKSFRGVEKIEIYYLTLFGGEPSKNSMLDLVPSKDFFLLSYQKHILEWIEVCSKHSYNNPILRETLKQYLILIQKLTFTMNENFEKEIESSLLANYMEAKLIASKFFPMIESITQRIRKGVIEKLRSELNEFEIIEGWPTKGRYAQIWIKFSNYKGANIFFGIESFSCHNEENMFMGIFSSNQEKLTYLEELQTSNKLWPIIKPVSDINSTVINFSEEKLYKKIEAETEFESKLIDHISKEVVKFVRTHKQGVLQFIEGSDHTESKLLLTNQNSTANAEL